MEIGDWVVGIGGWVVGFSDWVVESVIGLSVLVTGLWEMIMDSSQNSVLENELSVVIVDQQEEDQVEPIHGSPSRSDTSSRHDKQNVEVPKVGMKFDCDDSTYEFYKEYAQQIGFSVRK
ncbi:hypothetical protein SO802_027312 [Lithocarpus litseifolius]|uniref:Uncharacterized protein n=1 Tax=Lithocarpus litseifolius TaxID=425828 RepID=A0AAW2C4Q4_9ROSI